MHSQHLVYCICVLVMQYTLLGSGIETDRLHGLSGDPSSQNSNDLFGV